MYTGSWAGLLGSRTFLVLPDYPLTDSRMLATAIRRSLPMCGGHKNHGVDSAESLSRLLSITASAYVLFDR
jgi:hypothetical protein